MQNKYKYNLQKFFNIFGKIIKIERLNLNYTISQVAFKSKISSVILENIEIGNITDDITLNIVNRIAKNLDRSLYEIFIEIENIIDNQL